MTRCAPLPLILGAALFLGASSAAAQDAPEPLPPEKSAPEEPEPTRARPEAPESPESSGPEAGPPKTPAPQEAPEGAPSGGDPEASPDKPADPVPERPPQGKPLDMRAQLDALREQMESLEKRLGDQERQAEEQQRKIRLQEEKIQVQQDRIDDAAEAFAEKKDDPNGFKISYPGRLTFTQASRGITLKFGGRVHAQAVFYQEDEELERLVGDSDDGFQIRRARIELYGILYKFIEFKTSYDFNNNQPDFTDVFIGFKKIPFLGTLRVGQQKEPFGLEITESSNDFPFTERALLACLQVVRNTGVRFHNSYTQDRFNIHYAAGIFKDSNSAGNSTNGGEYHFTGRLALALKMDDAEKWKNSEQVFHIGASYSRRSPANDMERYRTSPETTNVPRFVDTGSFAANDIDVYGGELAMIYKSFSAQAEFIYNAIDAPRGGADHFFGYYAYVTYFLTGEHRAYKESEAYWAKVKVLEENRIDNGGHGAFEVGLRYSYLDLDTNDQAARARTAYTAINAGNRARGPVGGIITDITGAVNWYPFDHTRVQLNYVLSDVQRVGEADLITLRFQVVF